MSSILHYLTHFALPIRWTCTSMHHKPAQPARLCNPNQPTYATSAQLPPPILICHRWMLIIFKVKTLSRQWNYTYVVNWKLRRIFITNSHFVNRLSFIKNNLIIESSTVMLMSDGPWSPEHIYQEIVGYGKTRHRGKSYQILKVFLGIFSLKV